MGARQRVPISGEPADVLPVWGTAVSHEGVTAILHPPLSFEIAYRVPSFVILYAFGSAVMEVAIGEGALRRLRLRSGAVIIVPPETTVRAAQEEPLEFLVLAVERARFDAVAERVGGGPVAPEVLVNVVDPGIAALAGEIRRTILGDPIAPPAYVGALGDAVVARIVCQFLDRAPAPAADALAPATLRRVLADVEAHLAERVTVERMAAVAGLTRSHFSRAFRRTTGETPARFVLLRRLCRARELIAGGERSLGTVAVTAGFASQAHLSTVFRRELGLTPGRYRAAYGGDG